MPLARTLIGPVTECGFYGNPVKIMGIGMGDNERQTDGQLLERTRHETKKPELFKVLLLNDDYTTMEFVVEILESVFHKQPAEAYRIMMAVHTQGKGLCGVYPHEVAETKVATVIERARENGFPLLAAMEPE
jgi:ATP-dependent Clp protease adaptor protein ClpS